MTDSEHAAVLRHQHVSALARIAELEATVNGLNAEIDDMPYVIEIQRLLAEVKMSHDDHAFVVAERDAALAEVERLRAVEMDGLARHRMDELKAWRECAEQLAAQIKAWGYSSKALARFDALKAER